MNLNYVRLSFQFHYFGINTGAGEILEKPVLNESRSTTPTLFENNCLIQVADNEGSCAADFLTDDQQWSPRVLESSHGE